MGFWQSFTDRLTGKRNKPSTKGEAVPFAGSGRNAGGVHDVVGGNTLKWFGENIEGFDSLCNGGDGVDFDSFLPSDNSIVASCLNWITTSWMVTRLQVGRMKGDEFEPIPNHPLEILMRRPHPDYDGNWLVSAWMTDLFNTGRYHANIVTKGDYGPPLQLQYLPAVAVLPKGADDPTKSLIGWFDYKPGGGNPAMRIEPESMLYGRLGIDTRDPKLGRKPLYPARREIATDNLASEVAAALMKKPNPSGILSFDGDTSAVDQATLTEDMRETKRSMQESTRGGKSGEYTFLPFKVAFQPTSFNPKDLAMGEARRTPEERICALFGLPPIVPGLGAGLDKSTYNNLEKSILMAWTDCMIPLMENVAAVLTQDVLPLYPNSTGLICRWDTSNVGVLQPDINAEREEQRKDVTAGIITVDEARAERGLDPLPEPEPVDPNTLPPVVPPAPGAKSLRAKKDSATDTTSKLYRAASAFRSSLAKGEASAVDAMTAALDAAQKDIEGRLRALSAWIVEQEAAGVAPSENMERIQSRWRELSMQLSVRLAELATQGTGIVEAGQAKAATTGTTAAKTMADASIGATPQGVTAPTWNALPSDTLESLAGFLADGSPLAEYLSRVSGDYLKEVQNALYAGVARGAGSAEIAKDLGRFGDGPRDRYLTMVRTEVNRAAREASRESYAANADVVTAYVRLSAADGRTCPACWAEHGKEYPTSDPMPQHVQCRCVIVPRTKSWAEITGDDSIPDTRPTIESGETVFGKLSTEAQAEILGPGRYALYSEGKAKLADFAERTNDPIWGPQLNVTTVGIAEQRVAQ